MRKFDIKILQICPLYLSDVVVVSKSYDVVWGTHHVFFEQVTVSGYSGSCGFIKFYCNSDNISETVKYNDIVT